MEVAEAIRMKRAIREFSDQELPDEVVLHILNAGRRAQSAKNRQPWHFIAIRERVTLEALSRLGTFAGHVSNAALGIVILTPSPSQRWSIMFDAGQAAAYMQLAAWEMGVGSCLATIYEPDAARELLGFPNDLHLHVALSFGYAADEERMKLSPQGRGRRSFEDIVHYEQWSNT
jgi:nitroreductase